MQDWKYKRKKDLEMKKLVKLFSIAIAVAMILAPSLVVVPKVLFKITVLHLLHLPRAALPRAAPLKLLYLRLQ